MREWAANRTSSCASFNLVRPCACRRRTCRGPACRRSTRTTTSAAGSATGSRETAAGSSRTSARCSPLMDAVNVEAIVNLDGRWGEELEANLDRYDRAHPGRFFTFCHVDWADLDGLVDSLAASRDAGARGLKVWKDLGLGVTDDARRVPAARRPASRRPVGRGRRARPAGAHPHCRSGRVLGAARRHERAHRGARRRTPSGRSPTRASRAGSGCSTRFEAIVAAHPAHDVHRRARLLVRRGPGPGGPDAVGLPEPALRPVRADRRARPPAARREPADRAPPRPRRCSAPTSSRRPGRPTSGTGASSRPRTSTSPTAATRTPGRRGAGTSARSTCRRTFLPRFYRDNCLKLIG